MRLERELSGIIGTRARLLFDTITEQQNLPVAKVVDWATEHQTANLTVNCYRRR